MIKYTEEMKEFLREYTPGHHRDEIKEAFNNKFRVNASSEAIKAIIQRLGVKTGLPTRFEAGHIPYNKGMKQTEYMSKEGIRNSSKTRYKKGNKPINHKPVGTTRTDRDGYTVIKIAEPNKWQLLSRYNWENAYGKVPDDCVLVHIDGNPQNDDVENLVTMTRSELVFLNHLGVYGEDKELNISAILYAKTRNALKDAVERSKESGEILG